MLLSDEDLEKVCKILMDKYENKSDLNFNTPFELLIATILSAQCTDKRVNIVTNELFKVLKTPGDIKKLSIKELENYIKTCGLYKNKAKNIYETCYILINNFNSEVPKNMEDLLKLKGVGRKVANVVLSNAFGIPSFAVDTHVFRVSNELGIVNEKTVLSTEKALMKRIKKEYWIPLHHALVKYGREVATARKHKTDICPIKDYCFSCKKIANENIKQNNKKIK